MTLRVTVLGSGTALPEPDRGACGLVIHHGDRDVLVDGGSGTLQRLARAGVDALAIRDVVYSHRHADHTADLVPLLFAHKAARVPARVRVVAADGFARFLDGLASAWGAWVRDRVDLVEVPRDRPGQVDLGGGLTLDHAPAAHGHGALHLAWTDGARRVVFSGDTGPSDALVALARGADLLVCECAAAAPRGRGDHLSPVEVATLVAAARPGAVWLTHLYPDVDPAWAVATVAGAGVPTRRAHDGDRWPDLSAPRPPAPR